MYWLLIIIYCTITVSELINQRWWKALYWLGCIIVTLAVMYMDLPKDIVVGDKVQWTSQGVDQFKTPRTVVLIVEGYGFVDGSGTGLPLKELTRWE